MINEDLLKLLVCPENRTRLSLAEHGLLARLNDAIGQRRLKNVAGQTLEHTLGGALVREDQAVAYPVIDEIPMLLVDEGIPLAQLNG